MVNIPIMVLNNGKYTNKLLDITQLYLQKPITYERRPSPQGWTSCRSPGSGSTHLRRDMKPSSELPKPEMLGPQWWAILILWGSKCVWPGHISVKKSQSSHFISSQPSQSHHLIPFHPNFIPIIPILCGNPSLTHRSFWMLSSLHLFLTGFGVGWPERKGDPCEGVFDVL
jgi:hypothetical protein